MAFIDVEDDKTLGGGDDDVIQRVVSGGSITIPNDATFKFVIGDQLRIYNDSSNLIQESPVIVMTSSADDHFMFIQAVETPGSGNKDYSLRVNHDGGNVTVASLRIFYAEETKK